MAGGSHDCQPGLRRHVCPFRSGPMAKRDSERLAAALRDNLRKRKAQARAAADQPKKDPTQPASE